MSNRVSSLAGVLVVLLTATTFAQQEVSHLIGTVKDAQGAVLPGVTVTATAPTLIGSQTAITEPNGTYRFAALPAGTYTVAFELAGFQAARRENIVLALGQTLTIDMTLQLASITENVTVTAESPVVDTQTTAVGAVLNTARLITIPTSTDLWGALATTAGVRMQGYDVGGSHKMQQMGYEAFGVRNQTREFMEGLDTTSGAGGDMNYMDYFAQDQLSVTAAGGDVTMSTPGAAIVSTVKSGGNQFHGLQNVTYEERSFVGDNVDASVQARGGSGQPNLLFWEGHTDLGGPILRDKLWFYNAYNYFKINKLQSGVPENVATNLSILKAFTSKETYKLSPKDTVIGFYEWNWKGQPLRGLSTLVGPDAALAEFSPSWNYIGRWQRVWTNRLFSEFSVGTVGFDFPEQPNVDYTQFAPHQDLVTGVQHGAGWGSGAGPFDSARSKPQVLGHVTYFLPTDRGSHDLKAGVEWLDDRSKLIYNGTSGPILYLDRNGKPNEVRLTDVGTPATYGSGWFDASDNDRKAAVYFQDHWIVSNRFTATLGARLDHQRPYYTASQHDPALTSVFSAYSTPEATLLTRNTLVPRLGISWDPTGDSKSVIKAFYGRYYFYFADSFSGADPGGTATRDYVWNDLNGNGVWDGPQELGALVASAGGPTVSVDPNIKTPYTDEIDLSYDRQFWGESAFRVAYVRKMSRNQFTTFNAARVGQYTVPFTTTINLLNFDPNVRAGDVVGQPTVTLYDIPSTLKGVIRNTVATIPAEAGFGDYDYDTVDLSLNKRFGGGLFVNGSFDYQWRNELRQAATSSGAPAASNVPTTSDPLPVGFFFNPYPIVPNQQKSTTWQGHVTGRYVFPLEIGVGANLQVQSGFAYARLVSVQLPSAGAATFFLNPIDANRSDTVRLLSLRLDHPFRIRSTTLTAMLDVFNVLNSNAVTNFNLSNGARFNQINALLDPRTAEIGLRFEF